MRLLLISPLFYIWCFFFILNSSRAVFSLTLLEKNITDFSLFNTYNYSQNQLVKYQHVQNFLTQIIENYNKKNFKKALLLTNNAHRLVKELPNYHDILHIFVSIENIVKLELLEKSNLIKRNKEQKKLHWNVENISTKDQARYFFAIWARTYFNSFKFTNKNNIFRSGLGGTLEYFLPFFEKSFGARLDFSTNFLDFNNARIVNDYLIYTYSALLQYRLGWKLPAIDQSTTLTIKLGTNGHFVQNFIVNIQNKNPTSYLVPYLGISIQDPLLSRIFQNKFNKNLIFSVEIFTEYLPGKYERLSIGTNLGVYYRFSHFLIGPEFSIKKDYLTQNIQNHLKIGLASSIQI